MYLLSSINSVLQLSNDPSSILKPSSHTRDPPARGLPLPLLHFHIRLIHHRRAQHHPRGAPIHILLHKHKDVPHPPAILSASAYATALASRWQSHDSTLNCNAGSGSKPASPMRGTSPPGFGSYPTIDIDIDHLRTKYIDLEARLQVHPSPRPLA
ncbi:hypothetical protein D9611_007894 [Ephemerocybe angulata]|uniref:Uncharacterized protein n=1 Tax=Ephemerocybe angulata TaxID=980116 RepID=A0A8H5CFM4_9AGAR|nr:hypothetical protein D9611_007894 [Tulosesus angulatus]